MSSANRPELKQAIIRASVELGSQLGEEGLTMRAIAKRLGISATALYQHFTSKAEILHQIRVYGYELGQREVIEPLLATADPLERLRAWGRNYVAFARDNRWLYSVLMEHEQVDYATMTADEIAALLRPLSSVSVWIAEGRELGVIPATVDPDMSALRIITTVHGLCSLLNSGRVDENHPAVPIRDLAAFIDEFIESMVQTLRA